MRPVIFAPVLLVLLVGPPPSPAAPWDGIVGFLRIVSQLQDGLPEFQASENDGKPLRKIVYAVEDQVTNNTAKQNESIILYDSSNGGGGSNELNGATQDDKRKRSADLSHIEESARQNGGVVARPFLIGRKLWYVPLWFGVYLILYITALTVKSVARHRIKYPTLVAEDDLLAKRRNGYVKPDSATRRITNAISNAERRYHQPWSM